MTDQKFRVGQRVFVSPQSGFNGMGRESSFRLNDYEGKIARIIPIERDDRPIYVETFGNSDWFKAEELKLAAPVRETPQPVSLREGGLISAALREFIIQRIHEEAGFGDPWIEVPDIRVYLEGHIERTLDAMVKEGTLVQPIKENYTLPEFDYKKGK